MSSRDSGELRDAAMQALVFLEARHQKDVENYLSALSSKLRGFRVMTCRLAERVPVPEERMLDALRAAGDVDCSSCGLPYLDHPELVGYPTFHLVCNGKVVKL